MLSYRENGVPAEFHANDKFHRYIAVRLWLLAKSHERRTLYIG